ncbi:MAG: hypothetical protein R3A79_15105 [Nannocystaceae bacterium]
MDARDLELSRPCPIDLDDLGVDRSQPRVFCDHCRTTVTDLSKMREAEAAAFVAANRGRGVCISYLRNGRGEVLFADSPRRRPEPALVPVARLRRAAAVAALSLAACAPHGEHVTLEGDAAEDIAVIRSAPAIPDVSEPDLTPPPHVRAPEPEDDEPCDSTPTQEPEDKRVTRPRGKLRRTPPKKDPDWSRIDGGF